MERALATWMSLKKTLLVALAITTALAAVAALYLWGKAGVLVTFISVLCLALGLGLTEALLGAFTGMKKASPTRMLFVLLGKFGWWIGLFILSRQMPPGLQFAVLLGIVAFLIALLLAGLVQYGLPKFPTAK